MSCCHFNPRARVGRDIQNIILNDALPISIHAPAWGATKKPIWVRPMPKFQSTRPRGARPDFENPRLLQFLFQSTRPRGARPRSPLSSKVPAQFQSTRPRGARRADFVPRIKSAMISIHAPAWGATPCDKKQLLKSTISIHAPAWGATGKIELMIFPPRFQSTRPRGARLQAPSCPASS